MEDVVSLAAGRESSHFLKEDGSVASCGRNDAGQLADGTFVDSDVPVRADLPRSTRVRAVGAGPSSKSVFLVAGEDEVYAAGQNYRHQLGVGEVGPGRFPVPVSLEGAPGLQRVAGVSSSGSHTAALSCLRFTGAPTTAPTAYPTFFPTQVPTTTPTGLPSPAPTTSSPTGAPTVPPTRVPSVAPTSPPTQVPTVPPTTASPTTSEPTTSFPTFGPTQVSTVLGLAFVAI